MNKISKHNIGNKFLFSTRKKLSTFYSVGSPYVQEITDDIYPKVRKLRKANITSEKVININSKVDKLIEEGSYEEANQLSLIFLNSASLLKTTTVNLLKLEHLLKLGYFCKQYKDYDNAYIKYMQAYECIENTLNYDKSIIIKQILSLPNLNEKVSIEKMKILIDELGIHELFEIPLLNSIYIYCNSIMNQDKAVELLEKCYSSINLSKQKTNQHQLAYDTVCNQLGKLYLKFNNFQKSLEYFRKCHLKSPENSYDRAFCYFKQREFEKAENICNESLKINKDDIKLKILLSDIYFESGEGKMEDCFRLNMEIINKVKKSERSLEEKVTILENLTWRNLEIIQNNQNILIIEEHQKELLDNLNFLYIPFWKEDLVRKEDFFKKSFLYMQLLKNKIGNHEVLHDAMEKLKIIKNNYI
jgi:tetratricopeptide (TPR) repeat protein